MAAEKLIVDRSRADEFMTKFIAATKEFRMGDPTQMDNQIGPIVNEKQAAAVERRLDQAIEQGVTLEHGGQRNGLFFEPTVITGATTKMNVFHEEVFGPVANIIFADDEDDAIALTNDSEYGLSASIMTQDEARGMRVAQRIESGMAHINDTTI